MSRRMGSAGNSLYGKISPDSNDPSNKITLPWILTSSGINAVEVRSDFFLSGELNCLMRAQGFTRKPAAEELL